MTCSTASNSAKFAWSGVGIGEGTILKEITFRLSDFFFNKGLEHESGFFIATPRRSTGYMTMTAAFIQSMSTLSFEWWLLHHHHSLNMPLFCARLYAHILLRILQSTFHYIEFGRRTHGCKFVCLWATRHSTGLFSEIQWCIEQADVSVRCVLASPSDVSYGMSIYNDLSVSSGRSDNHQCQDLAHASRLVPMLWKKRHGTDYFN